MDALEWAKRAEDLGVGEIVVNSVDADGTRATVALGGAGQAVTAGLLPLFPENPLKECYS